MSNNRDGHLRNPFYYLTDMLSRNKIYSNILRLLILLISRPFHLKEIFVTSPFGIRTKPFTKKCKKHNGLDLRADRCETYAMMHGIVVKTGQDKVSGKYVTVRHGDFSVSYCHLSEWRVKKGDCVKPGDVVGISGNTGRSTGPHLHLAVRMGRRYINPRILLQHVRDTQQQALEKLSE